MLNIKEFAKHRLIPLFFLHQNIFIKYTHFTFYYFIKYFHLISIRENI